MPACARAPAGRAWLSLCEGHYNEKLLPILINAAPLAGLDDTPFKAGMEIVMRDKNQALDSLDKVGGMAA